MPWKEVSTMSQRHEFSLLAQQPGTSLRALCRRFGISPPTAYKWLARYAATGPAGLADRSRRPHQTPHRTSAALEAAVVALRLQHPTWGGRKLHARLRALGYHPVPAPSTITAILRRTPEVPFAEPAPPPGMAALCTRHAQCPVANGFQRPFRPAPRPVPPLDRPGRLLALRPLPARLSQ